MTVATANKTNANLSTENALDVEVSPVLWHVGEPTECPLITLLGGDLYKDGQSKPQKVGGKIGREESKEQSYKVIEKDPLARTLTVNGAVADTTTTTVNVDSATNCKAGDTLYCKQTGERMYIQSISTNALTVARNLGSTSHTVPDDGTLVIMGYAAAEGTAKAGKRSQLAAPRTRYLQIFKRTWGVTGTAQKVALDVNVTAWDEEQIQALANHKKDLEFSCWWNPYVDSTTDTDSNTVYLSRGIISEIEYDSDRVTSAASLSEDFFFGELAEKAFKYGPKRKALFCNAAAITIVNGFSRVKLQTKVKETEYGIDVQTIHTGHGIWDIMPCGAFDDFVADSADFRMASLDLSRVKYRFLPGRDTKVEENIQTPGTDAKEGQYITEAGFSVLSLPHHHIIKKAA